uniref:ABC transporter domain-containing protein n=2 Tax=Moniliophthora roreri TaxID=221103 RepID=A0A0W0FZ99_MONRR
MGQPTTSRTVPVKAHSDEVEAHQLGVYRVLLEKRPSFREMLSRKQISEMKKAWLKSSNSARRLIREVVSLDPILFSLLIAVKTWENTQNLFFLTLETRILQVIETGLTNGSIDARAFVHSLMLRMFCMAASSMLTHWCRHIRPCLQAAVKHHYDDVLMNARLNMDLAMLQDNMSHEHISSDTPWSAFEALLESFAWIVSLIGQIGFIFNIARSGNHGMIFALLCIVRPIMTLFFQNNIWTRPRVVEATDQNYLRMRALQGLTEKKYRHDIISGDIVQYILNEFRRARVALGNTSVDEPENQYRAYRSSFKIDALTEVSGDFPIMYFATLALLRPSQVSLSTIASLQQSTTLLRWCLFYIYWEMDQLRRHLSHMQQLYDVQSMARVIQDGDLAYPNEKESLEGMSFELRNVSFSYPGSDKKALDNVSFRINPGQLVVVVGANGSGKSTFVNVLTRLYDCSSGQILVDGEDIKRFKITDFRHATATLTQEHHLFPLSIAENIGLGYPEAVKNRRMIMQAARQGGAEGIIQKLDQGLDTVLDPVTVQYTALVDENGNSALSAEGKKLKKSHQVSGGEKQRLVAARTFMRFNSNKIKFVAVDEPSSALDPEGELELFNNLRAARIGKTMLFVTHRFGPLTKYADQILCMKDGKVVESGHHLELMNKKGEYFKMYNIQARAFDSGEKL